MAARIAVIAQARMGSSRLPGKILEKVGGRTVMAHVLSRARAIEGVDVVCCATTTSPGDDAVATEAERLGCAVCRGSPDDVLDRYARAAAMVGAAIVMRVTCDCPLLDPFVCTELIRLREKTTADYAATNLTAKWPHGLDCEIFTSAVLHEADAAARTPYEREHVTPWMRNHPRLVKASLDGPGGEFASMRWTVDYPEDLAFLRALSEQCDLRKTLRWQDIAAVVRQNPELLAINQTRRSGERPGSSNVSAASA